MSRQELIERLRAICDICREGTAPGDTNLNLIIIEIEKMTRVCLMQIEAAGDRRVN